MIELIYISLTIFTLYLIVGYFYWGIPRSISRTYYLIEKKKNRIFFKVVQLAFSLPLILLALLNPSVSAILLAMAGVFIIFSALAADTRLSKQMMKIHVYGAFGGIILAMLSIGALGFLTDVFWQKILFWSIPFIQGIFSYIGHKIPIKNHTTYIEMLAFYLTCLGLILYID